MQHAHNFGFGVQEATTVIRSLMGTNGSATHPYVQTLISLAENHLTRATPALADAAHYLGLIHGRVPGVIDHAASHVTDNAARRWLISAVNAFGNERAYLARLSVSLGPVPSTAGQTANDATALQLGHALDMLAKSERRGCALGAALCLVLDWSSIRALLDKAALRAGMEPSRSAIPSVDETYEVIGNIEVDPLMLRALQFGGRQLLQQHHGLWDILQARAELRAAEE